MYSADGEQASHTNGDSGPGGTVLYNREYEEKDGVEVKNVERREGLPSAGGGNRTCQLG